MLKRIALHGLLDSLMDTKIHNSQAHISSSDDRDRCDPESSIGQLSTLSGTSTRMRGTIKGRRGFRDSG
jgi:hypothetical protein